MIFFRQQIFLLPVPYSAWICPDTAKEIRRIEAMLTCQIGRAKWWLGNELIIISMWLSMRLQKLQRCSSTCAHYIQRERNILSHLSFSLSPSTLIVTRNAHKFTHPSLFRSLSLAKSYFSLSLSLSLSNSDFLYLKKKHLQIYIS